MRRRRTVRITSALFVGLLMAAALALSLRGTALAQQAPQILSLRVAEVPLDPASAEWQRAPVADVPLIPQAVALPRLLQTSIAQVSVRSVNDGQRIAFRLEWADSTRDAQALRPDQFRDAAAVLLGVSDGLPNICMGVAGQLTNLWHWKADWQEDLDKGFQDVVDAYPNFYKDSYPFVTGTPPYRLPADFASAEARQYFIALAAGNPLANQERFSPVEELLSAGFGTASHKPRQEVDGRGTWENGRWSVVFSRPLAAGDSSSASLADKAEVPVAFAVWNGSNQEVGARKQLSSFITVSLTGSPISPSSGSSSAGTPIGVPVRWEIFAALMVLVPLLAALAGMVAHDRDLARKGRGENDGGPGSTV